MNIRKLIPKNKHDHDVIPGLKKLTFDQIKPIVPDLLEWLQDMNWPIARAVADILEPLADKIAPEIIAILKTNDGVWKMWVLINVARNTTDPFLLSEIERIAKFPTPDEIEEEADLKAIAILN